MAILRSNRDRRGYTRDPETGLWLRDHPIYAPRAPQSLGICGLGGPSPFVAAGGGTPAVLQQIPPRRFDDGDRLLSNNTISAGAAPPQTVQIQFPNAITAGSRIIAGVYTTVVAEAVTVSDSLSSSWTTDQTKVAGSFGSGQLFSALPSAGTEQITFAFTTSSNKLVLFILEVSNCANGTDVGGALDTFFSGAGPTDIYWSNATLAHNSFVFACMYGVGLSNNALTLDSGWTGDAVSGNAEWAMMWKNLPSGSTTPHVQTASTLPYGVFLWNGYY